MFYKAVDWQCRAYLVVGLRGRSLVQSLFELLY